MKPDPYQASSQQDAGPPRAGGHALSGGMPLWASQPLGARFPALDVDLNVDVAIVGGGITGVMAAAQLARAGRTVALLEAQQIGLGNSGLATGNLYATTGEGLHALGVKWGDDVVEQVVRARLLAIELVERSIAEHRIACGFSREPWTLYTVTGDEDRLERIQREYNAARGAGLEARISNDLPLPYMIARAVVVSRQAQFNPLAYVQGLAHAIAGPHCRLFEDSPVLEIDADAGTVSTLAHTVRADHIVVATHTPKGVHVLHTELGPYREYAVAAPIGERDLPGGIFWSADDYATSTRLAEIGGRRHVLVIGERHKTGQQPHPEACYRRLEEHVRARFATGPCSFRWSAQQYRSADGLPYIGSTAAASNLYLATGFGADGLTWGALAGWMIADEIAGRGNPFAELFSPRRFTPMKSARNFLKENINVAGQYIADYAHGADVPSLDDIPAGEGRIVELDGERVAAYRDDAGRLHAHSAVCTHMKCIVHWNRAERSWDCPCHGSRFNYDGSVIEGPALAPLAPHAKPARREAADAAADPTLPPPA